MCRLAAYLGPEISLGKFLLEPAHSLYRQSWEPKEMDEAVLNADGFGFAWVNPLDQIASYTNICPIWSDINLAGLADALHSHYWLANVRSATAGQAVTQTNTHPFYTDKLLFSHNGFIQNFIPEIKSIFHGILDASIQAGIQGNTDSEYIFALLRQQLVQTPDFSEAIPLMLTTLSDIITHEKVLLNLIVGDGEQFHILRHAINGRCPTLYYSIDDDDFPGGTIIASEPLSESRQWQTVPEHSYATIRRPTADEYTQATFITL